MRSISWARWATCALAIAIPFTAAVAEGRKSVSTCTVFDQSEKGEDALQFTVHNSCTIPLDCSISWRVVCAPDSKKRRAVHPGSAKLALTDTSSQTAEASASVCGDDAW